MTQFWLPYWHASASRPGGSNDANERKRKSLCRGTVLRAIVCAGWLSETLVQSEPNSQLLEAGSLFLGGIELFLIFQIPFVDLRMLDRKKDNINFYPNLFIFSRHNPVYYRSFGSKQARKRTDNLPSTEIAFFKTKKLLRLSQTALKRGYRIAFQRLFTDKMFMHFDLGIKIPDDSSDQKKVDNILKAQKILLEKIFMIINNDGLAEPIDFYGLIGYIKGRYIYSTTKENCLNFSEKKWYLLNNARIKMCNPVVFINDKHKVFSGYSKTAVNLGSQNIDLNKVTLNYKDIIFHLWIFSNQSFKMNFGRQLRICLSKLHCYRECIMILLEYIEVRCTDLSKLDFKLLKSNLDGWYDFFPGETTDSITDNSAIGVSLKCELSTNGLVWGEIKRHLENFNNQPITIRKQIDIKTIMSLLGPTIVEIIKAISSYLPH